MSIPFDDLKNGTYSFRTFWNDIQQLTGFGPKGDASTPEAQQLVTLGKAVRAEFERVKAGSSMGLGDVSFAMVLQDMGAEQDKVQILMPNFTHIIGCKILCLLNIVTSRFPQ